jgi:lipopolysaccharide biosynthesis glycosyltransferase
MNTAFIACVEQGYLEDQVKLLCRSIRHYGGRYRDCPIYTFQPREGTEISPETLATLKDLNVTHITETLNSVYSSYPIGNKIFVCAWAERYLTEEILVFLDSDTMLCNEPDAFDLPSHVIAAVRPVDKKGQGSAGERDSNDSYWQRLYEICGVQARPFVRTTIKQDEIRAYFNAGLIVGRRSAGVFQQWKANFLKLMEASHIPTRGEKNKVKLNNMDQLSLAAILSDMMPAVTLLDERYNYPLPLRAASKAKLSTAQLSDLVHIHYHRWFRKPNFLHLVRPPLDPNDEIFTWLEPQLPLHPILDDPMDFRGVEQLIHI